MNPDGLPDITDISKAGEAGASFISAIDQIFPGIRRRSASKAESRETDRIIEDLVKIKKAQESLGLSDDSVSELMENAVCRHSRNVNFDSVLKFAEPMIENGADIRKVDRDWAEHFRDHAEKATDDDVRRTWAKILAGEINEPGSFSKRTMSILSDMSKKDVKRFISLCSCCCKADRLLPVFINGEEPGDREFFSIEDEMDLASLGLIDPSKQSNIAFAEGQERMIAMNHQRSIVSIKNEQNNVKQLTFSPAFTVFGEELAILCDNAVGTLNNLDRRLKTMAEKQGFAASIKAL